MFYLVKCLQTLFQLLNEYSALTTMNGAIVFLQVYNQNPLIFFFMFDVIK